MDARDLRELLDAVAAGRTAPSVAVSRIGEATADLGFARVDRHRGLRTGFPEVVFGPGKSEEEIESLTRTTLSHSPRTLLTRLTSAQAEAARRAAPDLRWHPRGRVATLDREPRAATGRVGILAAGTSDFGVAEEALLTASALGAHVETCFDVGVAGLHRLAAAMDLIRGANALVVVAGMEGALPSVVAGLTDRPVIAVPTSVGYGASFSGLAALLGMLNSCAAGVTVVNIDNGFGAGFAAATINRQSVGGGVS